MRKKILEMQTAYKEGTRILTESGDDCASVDAWYLMEYVTGTTRAAYYARPGQTLSKETSERYFSCIKMRSEKIPLQHITGEQEFMGYPFRVGPEVLIPRQDTEVLVEETLGKLQNGMDILDLCTGSGCILLSLLKAGAERLHVEGLSGTGIDLSQEALTTARENAALLGLEAQFIKSDLFDAVKDTGETYDLIVSNPPYICTEVIKKLQAEVRFYDPYMALDGGTDGLYFYRRIIAQSVSYIRPGGWLLFEIGCDQAEEVSTLMKQAGYRYVAVKKDLAGLDRVVCGSYNEE